MTPAFGQYAWFNQFSGNGYAIGTNLSISNDDAIYSIGNFNNGISVFGNSFSGQGSYILKLNKLGDLIWVKQVINPGNNLLLQIRSDDLGNIYITGMCHENVIIDGQTIPGAQNTSYVAKLNGEGELQWFQIVPVQNIYGIDVNKQGDLVLIGRMSNSIMLGGNLLSCSECSFGAQLTTTGTFRWAKTFGDKSFPIAATIDDAGNTYFNGNFWADFTLNDKSVLATGLYTLFYAKIDNLGACIWLTSVKQTVPSYLIGTTSRAVQYGALKTDGNGSLLAAGHYFKSVEFDNYLLPGNQLNEDVLNVYISKFNQHGVVEWAVSRINNNGGNSVDNVVVRDNTLYVTGLDGFHPFIYEYSLGGMLIRETVLSSFIGDVGGGFGIDSDGSQYVSGRINEVANPVAFVLKLGVPILPAPANAVASPLASCVSNVIEITTTIIAHADVYQWEILYKENTILIETATPVLLFSPSEYDINGIFKVRVRGKNANGLGVLSAYADVQVDLPISDLQVKLECTKIIASGSDSFQWFFNGAPASYPDNQIEINPLESGEYYIQQVNACGQKESNMVNYTKADEPFIPNIITPNTDRFNNFFVLPEFSANTVLTIFNRWGSEVFHSKAYSNNWSGGDLPAGVYFYQIKNSCLTNDMKGPLTIIR